MMVQEKKMVVLHPAFYLELMRCTLSVKTIFTE